ncbi:hypothetical protein [Niabella aurantiaca]|uniref:hypothetical protein n=1 Tax=Niabella aurantiaca TaxID=379900 RepID=UPI00037CFCAD|nr:hypothetical protein [Niabella aurantiaca]
MKKAILIAACFMINSALSNDLKAGNEIPPASCSKKTEWKKVTNQAWPGVKDGTTYWYKIDKKAKLWWSTDGKQWAAVEGGAWMDKDGKWLKIHAGKLVWSATGEKWEEVPEWKWQGSDGKWYRFDRHWVLWVNE